MKSLRQCCFCKTIKSKEELIRITKDSKTKEIKINSKEIYGRSVYICKNNECIQNALKRRKIEASLKCDIAQTVKDELCNLLTK